MHPCYVEAVENMIFGSGCLVFMCLVNKLVLQYPAMIYRYWKPTLTGITSALVNARFTDVRRFEEAFDCCSFQEVGPVADAVRCIPARHR